MAGVDLYTVSQFMGHSDIETTMRYAHLSPGHKADAMTKLEARLSRKCGSNMAAAHEGQ
jgi:site-specific recombinase XerD